MVTENSINSKMFLKIHIGNKKKMFTKIIRYKNMTK